MTATAQRRTMFDALIGEPLELALSQPHQILLSTGSVALMGSFASTSGIVDPLVGYLIAIGVEWAYLRGLASDSRAQTAWGGILNWSAFGIVVLWGVLWCAQKFGVYTEAKGGWMLAAAHVVPVAWLSLCSAQCHRAAMGAEKKATAKTEAQRNAWLLAQEEEDRKLERWKEAQRLKTQQEIEHLEAKARIKAAMPQASKRMPRDTLSESMNAETLTCPKCGIQLDRARWMAAKRWKYCSNCKEA